MSFYRPKRSNLTGLGLIDEKEQVESVIDNNLENLNKQIVDIKKNKIFEFLKTFLKNNIKYDNEEYILMKDLKRKFKEYCYSIDSKNLQNINYVFTKEDLLKIEPRIKFKHLSFCRSCKTRYRMGCCSENKRDNRNTSEVVLNFKFRH